MLPRADIGVRRLSQHLLDVIGHLGLLMGACLLSVRVALVHDGLGLQERVDEVLPVLRHVSYRGLDILFVAEVFTSKVALGVVEVGFKR